ncbi:MAG TPA: APC family permease [Elusimicrobiota bacterium]|nr:APC family permease [Elusimicrobiota bacterium]
MADKLKQLLLGKPRDLRDPDVFHKISLAAFLAWVGLGADGLSSSAYGPDEAYRALGAHTHLALLLVLMTAVTIFVISIAYSNLIEHFPGGGGGYLVATKLLGEKAGVVSGCALLVDYVLTISVSVASACDAMYSFLPPHWAGTKLLAAALALLLLLVLNLRGVKESVTFLAPIFMVFVISHAAMILYAIGSHLHGLPEVFRSSASEARSSVGVLGFVPVAFILLRAYSMGGGTYTGIEAVSNGVSMLREPRVQTGKRTMFLMATSLAFTAGGILLGYLLVHASPVAGQTMNAVLLENLYGGWGAAGRALIVLTLFSEAALLIVAAQAGFLDGPRVLSNMALDSWVPHSFSQLSDRLVTQNGIFLMGAAAIATLLYTKGDITMLVVMYSINVFLTFSLTELGMSRHWIKHRATEPRWKSQLVIHGTGLVMCVSILGITLYEKFLEGGWITAVITLLTIALCFWVRGHYREVGRSLKGLEKILEASPLTGENAGPSDLDPKAPTAVLTVSDFSGYGLHHILAIQRLLPGYFKNFVFVSVGVVDSGNFKGGEAVGQLELDKRAHLGRYVAWCRQHGLEADSRLVVGTETVATLENALIALSREFPRMIVFTGKLIFKEERWYQSFLHSETANAIQRRLQFNGVQAVVLPVRVY